MKSKKTELVTEVFDLARNVAAKQAKSHLTMIQLRTLIFIRERGVVKPTEIAKKFSITPASVTSQIDKLVNEGWLERISNQDDKRVVEVTLTKKGQRNIDKEVENFESNCSWIFENIDNEEEKQLLDYITRLNRSFEV
jgi:DNA-binding MarR family transcriptional regulator